MDEAHVRVRLGIVAPETARRGVEVLREQTQGRERGARALERFARLGAAARGDQGLDEPEGAEDEGDGRRAEAIVVEVPQEPSVLGETRASRVDGGSQMRIIRRQEVERCHLEQ